MPLPQHINPATGKRYGFVPPEKRGREKEEEAKALQRELQLLERRKKILDARDSLMTFTKLTMPHVEDPNDIGRSMYEPAAFHHEVAKVLEHVVRAEIPQLIFCMPPRHGKTELATKRLAAWYSGLNPHHDIIVASASDLLATDMGADVRAIMHSPAFKQIFPEHKLRRGGNAKDNIQTDKGGRLIFAGRGGTINGRGAHLLLVDDLYKDAQEAASETIRNQTWDWFTKVALYRRMGKRLTVLTMTRWHSDDIIGRLTDPENPHYNEAEAKAWKIIRLPGLAEDDDPLGRKPGEALWPERYDTEYHRGNMRRDPLGFAALTQQRPTVADGVLFRRENVQFYKPAELPEELRYYCASDHAVGTNQRNDPSCFVKVGVDKQNNIYVLDCFWQKVPTDRAVEAMLTMASGDKRPLLWWAEKGHISKSIGPFLYKRMQESGVYINLVEVTPAKDKEQRAQSIAARVAMGKVFFPRDAFWTERAINEMLAFPNGNHDDFVDALAYIGLGLQSQFGASVKKKVEEPRFGTLGWVKLADKWKAEQDDARRHGGF
jgi:predicted phage terminase large subunit-like protein